MAFSKKGLKMSMGRPPTEIFGVSEFFYRNFVKKIFRGRGAKKSTILALFSKIDPRNFDQLGKSVFFETSFFFEKSRKWGVIFGGAPRKFFHKFVLI